MAANETTEVNPGVEDVNLYDVACFIAAYWKLLLGAAVLAAAISAAFIYSNPMVYESSATLVIAPSRPATMVARPTLNVQAYQKLMESDSVVLDASRRLILEGTLKGLPSRFSVTTRVIPSSRPEESSTLEAVSSGSTPEEAAKITNVWVETFIKQVQKLIVETQSVSAGVVTDQLKSAKDQLFKLEATRSELEKTERKQNNEEFLKLDAAVAKSRNDGEDKIRVYADETRRLLEAAQSKGNLDAHEAQLASLKKAYAERHLEQARLGSQIDTARLQLDAAKIQFDRTPATLLTRKAVADDALWQTLTEKGGKGFDAEALKKLSLVSEVPNPLHEELARQLANLEITVDSLKPRQELLRAELAKMDEALKSLGNTARAERFETEKVQRERESGLKKLTDDAETETVALQRIRDRHFKDADKLKSADLAKAEREAIAQRELLDQLTKSWNAVVLAKSNDDFDDLRVAVAAVAPTSPTPRKYLVGTVAAGLAGAMLGLLIALIHRFSNLKPGPVLKA